MAGIEFTWSIVADEDSGPGPRSRHGLVFDKSRQATVLFGGLIWNPRTLMPPDTWEFSGNQWELIETIRRPPGRHRGAMVFDDERGFTVLFGGQDRRNAFLGDTWIYEDAAWRPVKNWFWNNKPSPRCGHSMTFDESLGLTVLFAGIDPGDNSLADTWTFDGHTWRPIRGDGPTARRFAALAYDPELEGCVLHGGSVDDLGHERLADTWLLQEGQWRKLPSGFDTNRRDDHALAYHRVAGWMLLMDGVGSERTILKLFKRGWSEVTVSPLHPRLQCSPLAWDENLNGLIMHGGEAGHRGDQFSETLLLRLSNRR